MQNKIHILARAMAANSSMTFEGSPCRNCGGTLRYHRSYNNCVLCQRKKCLEQYHSRKNQESKR